MGIKNSLLSVLSVITVLSGGLLNAFGYTQLGGGYICGQWQLWQISENQFIPIFDPYPFDNSDIWFADVEISIASTNEIIDPGSFDSMYTRIWMPEFQQGGAEIWGYPNDPLLIGIADYQIVPDCNPTVNFTTDRETIYIGECVILHWYVDISGLYAVYLENELVDPEGTREVCPVSETSYSLRAVTDFEEISRHLTIEVLPSPTSTPTFPVPTATIPPLPTLTVAPTPLPIITPTSLPVLTFPTLEVIDFNIEPSQVSIFEMVRITIVIENKGAPLSLWEYSGEVLLENRSGEAIERHSFAKGDASYINPVIEDGKLNLEKWRLVVKVRFSQAVSDGKVVVIIQPEGQQVTLRGEGSLIINPDISGLTCLAVTVNKLFGPFMDVDTAALMKGIVAELEALGCEANDYGCMAPPLVKALLKIVVGQLNVGKLIVAIWGVFDTDALAVCRDPVNWMWQLTEEFNRQGIPINLVGGHSPMQILVTNSSGQRAGFVLDDEIVTEIPDSRVIEWEGDKYVIYPADSNTTVLLTGTGNGIANLNIIDGQLRREVSFSNISVSNGSSAWLNLSEQQIELAIDTNSDGNIDEVRHPESVEVLQTTETPVVSTETPMVTSPDASTSNLQTGICGGSLGLILLLIGLKLSFRKKVK